MKLEEHDYWIVQKDSKTVVDPPQPTNGGFSEIVKNNIDLNQE